MSAVGSMQPEEDCRRRPLRRAEAELEELAPQVIVHMHGTLKVAAEL